MGQSVMFTPSILHFAGVGHDHAARHAEAGRLARPVGAQQAHDLAAFDAEIDAVDHPPRAVDLYQSFGFEQYHLTNPILPKLGKNGKGILTYGILFHEWGQ